MDKTQIQKLYQSVVRATKPSLFSSRKSLLHPRSSSVRPLSISIEEPFFGDSGKGRITTEMNTLLKKRGKLYSLRFNGGANTGHEVIINRKVVTMHQLPMAIVTEGATAIISRGMLLHPEDLLSEISHTEKLFGGSMPGKLVIDHNVILSLDTHRAYEHVINTVHEGGKGSTGRGISPGYMSFYGRFAVTVRDLLQDNWEEVFRKHYRFYGMHIKGFNSSLKDILVRILSKETRMVGTESVFINRLNESRRAIKKYVSSSVYYLLRDIWNNEKIPVTIEGAQGTGLDPFHGVYPDITASRTATYHIMDATYGIISPEEIAVRIGVVKGPYMSSVGRRRLPTIKDEKWERWIQESFHETGRSTGRLRDIYPISIPMAQYFRHVAGFHYLAVTHLDASRETDAIRVIAHYTDKKTKKESPYLPYQYELDKLEAHAVEFRGWDGEAVKKAKRPQDLPISTQKYLSFLSHTIAPVIFATTGEELGENISWMKF